MSVAENNLLVVDPDDDFVSRAKELFDGRLPVARTIEETGLQPSMSHASALRQEWAANFRSAAAHEELAEMLDAVLCLARPETSQC